MDLINTPLPVRTVLSAIGPIAALFPKKIMNLRYRRWTGNNIDWKHPRTLQESILSRMMEARKNPDELQLYAQLADKVAVRDYVSGHIGEEALTKLYGVWERPEDIDYSTLPVPCVIKTNNGCATNIIIRSRADLDPEKIGRALKSWLRFPYGALSGQPHYSAIPPRILCEEYLEQNKGTDDLPYDYKIFCFNGEPRFVLYYAGRTLNSHLTYNLALDPDWNVIEGAVKRPSPSVPPKPEIWDEVLRMARELSRGIPFVRVDFYIIGNRAVFGEMTFTPDVVINFTPEFLSQWNPETLNI